VISALRSRSDWRCEAVCNADDSGEHDKIVAQMSERHGSIVDLINSLSDFHLYRFEPGGGRYVAGFGKTYCVNGCKVSRLGG